MIILTITDKVNQLLRIRNHVLIPNHGVGDYNCFESVEKLDNRIDYLLDKKSFAGDLL